MRFRLRTLLIVLALGPPILALIAAVVVGGIPFSHHESVCYECGMERETRETWGRITKDEIHETDVSRWVKPLLASGHTHDWKTTTVREQSTWFGGASIGCGGFPEGAFAAWQLAYYGNQNSAEQSYREYQEILNGKSPKSIADHRKEVSDAVHATVQAKRQRQIDEAIGAKTDR